MSKLLLISFLFGLVWAAAGCGGGGGEASDADASKPETLLVTSSELPGGSTSSEIAPELCGPVPVLEGNGGQTAVSKTLLVGGAKVVEAVGAFATPAQAMAAFAGLNDGARLECIENAIYNLGSAGSLEITESEPPEVGDEGAVVRYVSFDDNSANEAGSDSEPNGYSDIVAVRVGRCTAALLIGTEDSEPPDEVSEETVETVADRLADACG